MNDKPDEPESPPAPTGVWEHWCERLGCTKWGGWGYAGRWFCMEHKPEQ